MSPSDNCITLIKSFEGFRNKPYLCSAGKPTIGYGSRFYKSGKEVTLKDSPISEAVACELLDATLDKEYCPGINNNVKVPLTQNQFDALVCFVYNIGVGNFKSSTMLSLINQGDYNGAAKQFIRWNKETKRGVKVENAGLTKRRIAERDLFLKA